MSKAMLRCSAHAGMFSDERFVELNRRGDGCRWFIVPSHDVVDCRDGQALRVVTFERDGAQWAVLPTSYRDTIPVAVKDLVSG